MMIIDGLMLVLITDFVDELITVDDDLWVDKCVNDDDDNGGVTNVFATFEIVVVDVGDEDVEVLLIPK